MAAIDRASRALLTHTRMWYLIDAKNQRPGRIANQISTLLQGKHKPIYAGLQDVGDHVVVINADRIEFSGKKWEQKLYRKHTGYPGGFREERAKDLHARKPLEALKKATAGMLPKNRLKSEWMNRLHLFEGEEHPYEKNIAKVLTSKHKGQEQGFELASMVMRPPGDLHLLEKYLDGEELELIGSIPAVDDKK